MIVSMDVMICEGMKFLELVKGTILNLMKISDGIEETVENI